MICFIVFDPEVAGACRATGTDGLLPHRGFCTRPSMLAEEELLYKLQHHGDKH
jgi:hypothetical protein